MFDTSGRALNLVAQERRARYAPEVYATATYSSVVASFLPVGVSMHHFLPGTVLSHNSFLTVFTTYRVLKFTLDSPGSKFGRCCSSSPTTVTPACNIARRIDSNAFEVWTHQYPPDRLPQSLPHK